MTVWETKGLNLHQRYSTKYETPPTTTIAALVLVWCNNDFYKGAKPVDPVAEVPHSRLFQKNTNR